MTLQGEGEGGAPRRIGSAPLSLYRPPLPQRHGWVRICLHCQVTHWPITLMHIDCDSHSLTFSLSPAGHRGADPELWTDAISVAYRATSSTQLRHAPGENSEHAGHFHCTSGCVRVYFREAVKTCYILLSSDKSEKYNFQLCILSIFFFFKLQLNIYIF